MDIRYKSEEDIKFVLSKIEGILKSDNFYNKNINEAAITTGNSIASLKAMRIFLCSIVKEYVIGYNKYKIIKIDYLINT